MNKLPGYMRVKIDACCFLLLVAFFALAGRLFLICPVVVSWASGELHPSATWGPLPKILDVFFGTMSGLSRGTRLE
jgi:hypothetical protein